MGEAEAVVVIISGADTIAVVDGRLLCGRLIDEVRDNATVRASHNAFDETALVVFVTHLVIVRIDEACHPIKGVMIETGAVGDKLRVGRGVRALKGGVKDGIGDALDGVLNSASGIVRGVFLAVKVPDIGEHAACVVGGCNGVVALVQIGHRHVVEVGHVRAVVRADGRAWVERAVGRKGQSLVMIILGKNPVRAVVGVGDALVLGIGGLG